MRMREMREEKLIKVERCYKCAWLVCVNGNSKIQMGDINSWSYIVSPVLLSLYYVLNIGQNGFFSMHGMLMLISIKLYEYVGDAV